MFKGFTRIIIYSFVIVFMLSILVFLKEFSNFRKQYTNCLKNIKHNVQRNSLFYHFLSDCSDGQII